MDSKIKRFLRVVLLVTHYSLGGAYFHISESTMSDTDDTIHLEIEKAQLLRKNREFEEAIRSYSDIIHLYENKCITDTSEESRKEW